MKMILADIKKPAAAVIAAAVIMCGCDSLTQTVTETTAPTSESLRVSGELLISDDSDTVSDYPVTVNDVVISGSPQRVICLSSSLTEIIYELGYGGRLIGRGSYCDYPESAAALKDFGKPASPDLDAIRAASPELVITATSIPSKDVTALSDIGISVLYIQSPRSVEEFGRIYTALGMVFGGLFDGEKAGGEVFGGIKTALQSCDASLGRFVYVTEGGAVAGGDTFEGSVLSLYGENIAAGASGYSFDKSLLADDQPDSVVLSSDVPLSELTSDSIFGGLDAVNSGRIFTVSNSFFESPSGRITEITKELSADEGAEDEA